MPTGSRRPTEARPAISVVVPFRGDRRAAARALAHLRRLELGDGDELRVADNSDGGSFASIAAAGIVTVRANGERSSYHARNAAARGAHGEWLLFCDADCAPAPDLLDVYFADPVAARCGVLAGGIGGDPGQAGLIARYARDRNFVSQTDGMDGMLGRAAATGNMLVRRGAFEAVGGFAEGIRSGGDIDLCWRLEQAGWALEHRPGAAVVHRDAESLGGLLGQVARYGAGARWLDARHPGASPRWPLLRGLAGSASDIVANLGRGRVEEATFRGIDAIGLIVHNLGYMASNRAPRIP